MPRLPEITITRAAVHRIIPKEELTEHATIEPSSNLVQLSAEMKEMIVKRINSALRNDYRTFALEIERTDANSFFTIASSLFTASMQEYIQSSVEMAQRLARTQKHSSIPGGFFILLQGSYGEDGRQLSVVIKAEPHEALQYSVDEEGISHLEMLKSVFLSPSQKLFKIGVLFEREEVDGDEINDIYGCLVYDAQFRADDSPAEYFYRDFLGLTTTQNARIQSKRFYEKTREFASQIETPDFDVTGLNEALRLELTETQDLSISPMAFAEKHIAHEDLRTEYVRQVAEFMPDTFYKDPGLIQQQLKTRKIEFENRVRITGPEEAFNRSVQILEQSQDHLVVRITARRKYSDHYGTG